MFNKLFVSRTLLLIIGICIGIGLFLFANADNHLSNDNSKESNISQFEIFEDEANAKNYLRNGDFFSRDKPSRVVVDTSYLNHVDASIHWYDKVILEFPNTKEANIALKAKIETIIGWSDGYGKDKKNYGLKNTSLGAKYFPIIKEAFETLESNYPNDNELSTYAFQIGQSYLLHILYTSKKEYIDSCKQWMNKVHALADGKETFYTYMADHWLTFLAKHYR